MVALILFSPVMAAGGCARQADCLPDPPNSQAGAGRHCGTGPFCMYKFRSMEVQAASAEEQKAWTAQNDPRVTPIGKFMRRTSIDELPQLVQCAEGRYEPGGAAARNARSLWSSSEEEIPTLHGQAPGAARGSTGWAQVNGYQGRHLHPEAESSYDLYYIENWTLGTGRQDS